MCQRHRWRLEINSKPYVKTTTACRFGERDQRKSLQGKPEAMCQRHRWRLEINNKPYEKRQLLGVYPNVTKGNPLRENHSLKV